MCHMLHTTILCTQCLNPIATCSYHIHYSFHTCIVLSLELQMKEFGHAERVKQRKLESMIKAYCSTYYLFTFQRICQKMQLKNWISRLLVWLIIYICKQILMEEVSSRSYFCEDCSYCVFLLYQLVLEQGSGVALKLLTGYHLWFSCWYYQNCHTDPCPGHEFDDSERIPCRGEAFKMYRALGPGEIRTGDFVGLYYPEEGNWFAVTNGVGQKSSCPGAPTMNDGFSSYGKWVECGDSAFQVYAKGKVTGEKITDKDILAFYHPGLTEKTYVEFLSNSIGTSTCLRDAANNIRPPPSSAYDNCVDNTVQLTIYV